MLKNYLTIALRNLQRHPGFTAINVVGLAVGLAVCSVIALYVQHERSYDDHHERADRIVRVTTHYPAEDRHWATTSPPVGPALRRAIPEIAEIARFAPFSDDMVLRYRDRQFEEPGGVFADATVFEVFTLPLLRGTPETALSAPHTVVISEELARKYFSAANPLGRTLDVIGWGELTVTGVMENLPSTTHLPFDFMVSMATFYVNEPGWVKERTWERFYTYALLTTPEARSAVAAKLPSFVASFFESAFEAPTEAVRLDLQPVRAIHLHSHLEREFRPNRDVRYVYMASAIALFVLLIACVNFVNLSTAQAARRRREVGVRKALGADRHRLVGQFLAESVLLASGALLLAGLLLISGLPLFNRFAGISFTSTDLFAPVRLAYFVGIGVATGIGAGLYPAFVLSGFRPTRALRGAGSTAGGSPTLRQGLVVFQFAVSMILIIGTAVIHRQLQYVYERSLGFDQDRVAAVRLAGGAVRETVRSNPETIKQELKRHPAIQGVSLASNYPGSRYNVEPVRVVGDAQRGPVEVRVAWGVDRDYLSTLGIDLVEGRDFSHAAPADTAAWLINRAAARRLGLDEPVGKRLQWRGYTAPIVGVTDDFHFASLHDAIEPLALPLRPTTGADLLVRVDAGQSAAALRFVEERLRRIAPDPFFRHSFLDDTYEQLYATEERLRDIVAGFAILAILIACLGLFGLAAFTAQQRTKEIGIRKVLGATVAGIVGLLARGFVRLVGLGFVVAAPLAYWVMDRWLEDFAYRIDLGPWIFLGAGALAFVIALLTVSYQAVRAARTDPTQTLRTE